MKEFRIHLYRTVGYTGYMEVEAESKEDALERFNEEYDELIVAVDWDEDDVLDELIDEVEEC